MKLFKMFGGNTLYYPGCLTKIAAKDLEENYKKILKKCGVEFIQLSSQEVCCGRPILNSGHKKEAIELAEKNFKIFKDHSVSKIITSCPACYHMFVKDYPELVKNWDIEVEFITKTINNAIKSGKIKSTQIKGSMTYHDPCHFSRVLYYHDEPREVLKSSGAELREMKLSKNYAFCCGAGSGVKSNYPEIANSIGKERIKMAKETKADILITCCPMCYMHLKENNSDKTSKLKVMEFSQLFEDENPNGENKK
ncbi:MAG: (Fe-S)-binding protein [Candidatus Pacearchaeota archaeon]|jgi:Fe-S oxidoreductase